MKGSLRGASALLCKIPPFEGEGDTGGEDDKIYDGIASPSARNDTSDRREGLLNIKGVRMINTKIGGEC